MRGIVKYFLPNFNYGFIVYRSSADLEDGVFDKDVYFRKEDFTGSPQRGDHVVFEIRSDEKDRPRAFEIAIIDDRATGTVVTTGVRGYGFIKADDDGEELMFHLRDTYPDAIGRFTIPVGGPVSFRRASEEGLPDWAIDVQNEDPNLDLIDAANYREIGKIEFIDGGFGKIRRPCGDIMTFAMHAFSGSPELLSRGDFVEFSVHVDRWLWDKTKNKFRQRSFAKNVVRVEYVEPNSIEEQFLSAPELPISGPSPESIFSAVNRSKTLRQLATK